MRTEAGRYCAKLQNDIIEVEALVQRNTELADTNKNIQEKNDELLRQLCEMQDKLITKDKVCFYVENRFLR